MITVRKATPDDAEAILGIYAYYVQNTAVTFEYDVPALDEFRRRIETTLKRYPYLVLCRDGTIAGYAYAGPLKARKAYDWSCETTIYLSAEVQKGGYGKRLYDALATELSRMGITNMYACIAVPEEEDAYLSRNSADFHAHIGFTKVGEFRNCANKFHRWYHMIWMGKEIGEHKDDPPPVRPYPEVAPSHLS